MLLLLHHNEHWNEQNISLNCKEYADSQIYWESGFKNNKAQTQMCIKKDLGQYKLTHKI